MQHTHNVFSLHIWLRNYERKLHMYCWESQWKLIKHLSILQALGKDVESVYVEELGQEISKKEIFDVLVMDPMMGAIEVDWRDFFPYLRWIPNRSMEMKIQRMVTRKRAVTRALINEQRKRIALGEVSVPPCFSLLLLFLVLLLLTMILQSKHRKSMYLSCHQCAGNKLLSGLSTVWKHANRGAVDRIDLGSNNWVLWHNFGHNRMGYVWTC